MSDRPLNPTCYACGRTFDHAKQELRTTKDYNPTADGTLCRNQPECRGRILAKSYKERGLKRWARQTQEQLLAVMDVPPPGWDKKKPWESVHSFHERVGAAIDFFSVCWPVCLPYAVQTDADGEPVKEFGEWKRHTHRSLAAVLYIPQSSVTRAIEYRKRRNLLTEIDGRLYPEANPKSLNAQERDACTRISVQENQQLRALPRKTQKILADLWPLLEPDACTRINAVALDACRQLNRAISDARTEASRKVLDACHAHVSLLSRLGDYKQTRASERANPVVSELPAAEKPPARPPNDDGIQTLHGRRRREGPLWHNNIVNHLETLPIPTFLDKPMLLQITDSLSEELVNQFIAATDPTKGTKYAATSKDGKGIRNWAGVLSIAKQVVARRAATSAKVAEHHEAASEQKHAKEIEDLKWIAENDEESEARDYAIKQLLHLEIPLARKAAS